MEYLLVTMTTVRRIPAMDLYVYLGELGKMGVPATVVDDLARTGTGKWSSGEVVSVYQIEEEAP